MRPASVDRTGRPLTACNHVSQGGRPSSAQGGSPLPRKFVPQHSLLDAEQLVTAIIHMVAFGGDLHLLHPLYTAGRSLLLGRQHRAAEDSQHRGKCQSL